MGSSKHYGWDTKPKLDEARVIAPEAPTHRSRKNTKRWCRGKPGVVHVTAVETKFRYGWEPGPCAWYPWAGSGWGCHHVERCTECRKILRWFRGRECPDWKPRET